VKCSTKPRRVGTLVKRVQGSRQEASKGKKARQRHSKERRAHQGKGHLCSKASRHKF
jgi:hypothetical protein